jgi:ATP-dependent DNA ligase
MTLLYKQHGKSIKCWTIDVTSVSFYTTTWVINESGESKNLKMSDHTEPKPKKGQTVAERVIEVAQQKTAKMIRDGYSYDKPFQESGDSLENAAKTGKTPKTCETFRLSPMLAKPYKDFSKLPTKVAMQPKLDGVRMVTICRDGKNTAYSRQLREFPAHIQDIVRDLPLGEGDYLDGELMLPLDFLGEPGEHEADSHKAALFQQTVSAVKKLSVASGFLLYMVYDLANINDPSQVFEQRYSRLEKLCSKCGVAFSENNQLVQVSTEFGAFSSEKSLKEVAKLIVSHGLEGMMLRDPMSPYTFDKRSSGLLKVKFFDDAEFQITGFEYGQGKNTKVITWVLKNRADQTFRAVQTGSDREWPQERALAAIGQKMTVRYQGLTADGLPRFPVALAIRDYEG